MDNMFDFLNNFNIGVRLSHEELCELYENKPLGWKDVVFNANIGLVISMIPSNDENKSMRDDLFQEGCLGLIKAIDKFDHTKGIRFSTYAGYWIWGYIGRAYGKYLEAYIPSHIQEDIKAYYKSLIDSSNEYNGALTLGECVEIGNLVNASSYNVGLNGADTPLIENLEGNLNIIDKVAMREIFDILDKSLSRKQLDIIIDRYYNNISYREIGEARGISKQRAYQLGSQSINKCKSSLANKGYKNFSQVLN